MSNYENSAKAIVALFGPIEKTHSPDRQLKRILEEKELGEECIRLIEDILPLVGELGFEQHLMTDYGDEISKKVPWEIFTEDDAQKAVGIANKCLEKARLFFERYTGT